MQGEVWSSNLWREVESPLIVNYNTPTDVYDVGEKKTMNPNEKNR